MAPSAEHQTCPTLLYPSGLNVSTQVAPWDSESSLPHKNTLTTKCRTPARSLGGGEASLSGHIRHQLSVSEVIYKLIKVGVLESVLGGSAVNTGV